MDLSGVRTEAIGTEERPAVTREKDLDQLDLPEPSPLNADYLDWTVALLGAEETLYNKLEIAYGKQPDGEKTCESRTEDVKKSLEARIRVSKDGAQLLFGPKFWNSLNYEHTSCNTKYCSGTSYSSRTYLSYTKTFFLAIALVFIFLSALSCDNVYYSASKIADVAYECKNSGSIKMQPLHQKLIQYMRNGLADCYHGNFFHSSRLDCLQKLFTHTVLENKDAKNLLSDISQ